MHTSIINYLLGAGMMLSLILIPKKIFWVFGKNKEKLKYLPLVAGLLPAVYTILYTVYLHVFGKPDLSLEVFLNFLQHSIGGGVACGLITFYLYANFVKQLPILKDWRIRAIGVFAIVSMLGVANEIIELSLDLLKFGQYSRDRFDTWIDLVANTTGAYTGFYLSYVISLGYT
jgi:hypothetical protein